MPEPIPCPAADPSPAPASKLRKGARVRLFGDPERRTRYLGTGELVRYVRSPIGRYPLQVWEVRVLTVVDARGVEFGAGELGGMVPAIRVVGPADLILEDPS